MGKHKGDNDGFSLLELVVVVAVLAILAAIGIPMFNFFIKQAAYVAGQWSLANARSSCAVKKSVSIPTGFFGTQFSSSNSSSICDGNLTASFDGGCQISINLKDGGKTSSGIPGWPSSLDACSNQSLVATQPDSSSEEECTGTTIGGGSVLTGGTRITGCKDIGDGSVLGEGSILGEGSEVGGFIPWTTDTKGLKTVERGFFKFELTPPALEEGEVQVLMVPGGERDMKLLLRGIGDGKVAFLVAGAEQKWSPTEQTRGFESGESMSIGFQYAQSSYGLYYEGGSMGGSGPSRYAGDKRDTTAIGHLGDIDEESLVDQLNQHNAFAGSPVKSVSSYTGKIDSVQHIDMNQINSLPYATMMDYVDEEGDQVPGTIFSSKDWSELQQNR